MDVKITDEMQRCLDINDKIGYKKAYWKAYRNQYYKRRRTLGGFEHKLSLLCGRLVECIQDIEEYKTTGKYLSKIKLCASDVFSESVFDIAAMLDSIDVIAKDNDISTIHTMDLAAKIVASIKIREDWKNAIM